MKSRRMILTGYVARIGETRNSYKLLVGKPERNNHSEDVGVDGSIILDRILENGVKLWTGFIRLREGTHDTLL
jgi:hypothetical protein